MDEENQKKKYKIARITIQITILVVLLGLAIWGTILLYPIFRKMQADETYLETILEKVRSYGAYSWLIILGLQIIQTVLAIIPAGPIVIITGMLYHPALAVFICLVGQTLGALVVIGLVKAFGYSFLALFIDPEQPKKFKLLQDGKRCGVLMFSYLLIPFLPKDPIAFIVPFTKVQVKHFIWISFVARLPMTIVSVLFGNSLVSGDMTGGIIIASLSFILSLLCFIFNKKIVAWLDKITSKKTKEIHE